MYLISVTSFVTLLVGGVSSRTDLIKRIDIYGDIYTVLMRFNSIKSFNLKCCFHIVCIYPQTGFTMLFILSGCLSVVCVCQSLEDILRIDIIVWHQMVFMHIKRMVGVS